MRKPANRRSNHFELPGLPGLESRRLLAADLPMFEAEIRKSQRPEEPMRFEEVFEVDMPPKPAMALMANSIAPAPRMSDSTLVRPAFDAFRQIPGGPDRLFATTVGDSLSVKFGSPIGTGSQSGSTFHDSSGAAWSAPADIETATRSGFSPAASTGSSISLVYSSVDSFFRVPMTVRINSSMQVNPSPFSKPDRMGPAPLMAPSAPSFLVMVSPDTSSTFAAASQASASEKPGKSNLEISQTPNRSQPQGDPDDTGTSCLSIHEDPGLDVVSLSGSGQEIVSASIAKPPDASGRKPAPPLPREGVTQSDSIARENPYQNPGQPAIWTRISEAFGIEDSDFGSIGSEPLEEPVEIDADELSAAVDRIIDGFAQPVEDSLGGPQFGKTVGMAAGLAIAVQIYVRRRRFMDESNGAEADERSELRTYVSPQLDQLDESDL